MDKKPKFKVRTEPLQLCGRRGYYRKFEMCRICLRISRSGEIPGVIKSSW